VVIIDSPGCRALGQDCLTLCLIRGRIIFDICWYDWLLVESKASAQVVLSQEKHFGDDL
jgi:hypothetical protein